MNVPAGDCVKNGADSNVIKPVPPFADTVMVPSQPGVQVGDVVPVTLIATAVGCVTQTDVVFVQLFASVTVIV